MVKFEDGYNATHKVFFTANIDAASEEGQEIVAHLQAHGYDPLLEPRSQFGEHDVINLVGDDMVRFANEGYPLRSDYEFQDAMNNAHGVFYFLDLDTDSLEGQSLLAHFEKNGYTPVIEQRSHLGNYSVMNLVGEDARRFANEGYPVKDTYNFQDAYNGTHGVFFCLDMDAASTEGVAVRRYLEENGYSPVIEPRSQFGDYDVINLVGEDMERFAAEGFPKNDAETEQVASQSGMAPPPPGL